MSESFWSLVTQLCVRLAGSGESNSNNGAMTVPVQKLRNFAFSILLKQGSASEHGAGKHTVELSGGASNCYRSHSYNRFSFLCSYIIKRPWKCLDQFACL